MVQSQIKLICEFCKTVFSRTSRSFGKNNKYHFCSRECCQNFRKQKQTKFFCSFCNKIFSRKKSLVRNKNVFCSKECRKLFKIEQIKVFCKKCGKDINRQQLQDTRKLCETCRFNKTNEIPFLTLNELKTSSKNFHSRIRDLARNVYKNSGLPLKCCCGYDKYIEIAHIKAIKDFSRESLLKEINNINNLVALCRNCHWEYDHGLLSIFDILKNKTISFSQ